MLNLYRIIVLAALTFAAIPAAAAEAVTPPGGPVTAADANLIVRVHLATLWEVPVGEQAEQRGRSAIVRRVGEHLAMAHIALDGDDRALAARLGIELPTQPNADQQQWLAELTAASPADYDRAFVNILRAAHGAVFAVVTAVRAETQNSLVRAFATKVMGIVLDHMTLLESTGLVNYAALAASPSPSSSSGAAAVPGSTVAAGGRCGSSTGCFLRRPYWRASVGAPAPPDRIDTPPSFRGADGRLLAARCGLNSTLLVPRRGL